MLFPAWLSPAVRNAIIREYGKELGLTVRSQKVRRNEIMAAVLEQSVREAVADMKRLGIEKGRRRELAFEQAGEPFRLSANTVRVRIQRLRRRRRAGKAGPPPATIQLGL